MNEKFVTLFDSAMREAITLTGNYAAISETAGAENQQQTNEVFSEKWEKYSSTDELEKFYQFQRDWYLALYGFKDEAALKAHLAHCSVIVDAGCGLGYKAAWFASLAPHALVIGIDYSAAARQASEMFADHDNLVFLRGDIGSTPIKTGAVDYVSCDQVIMHTENPDATFAELCRITSTEAGQFACYFYTKKALPRELLDDYFRLHCKEVSTDQLWEMSEQLMELGKRLSELKTEIDVPEIPLMGIKGGKMDIQRFIYWNFLKCFWNPELGHDTSLVTNFDWYSPSNARRFSEAEVRDLVSANDMGIEFFRMEEAAYTGRFVHQ